MENSATLNHAASVISTVSPKLRADTALRRYFAQHEDLHPAMRRAVSHAVFIYYRWFQWLDPKLSTQRRVEAAVKLHLRFKQEPAAVKPEALAVRAVPEWAHTEMDLSIDCLRILQQDPALWLRARPHKSHALAAKLGTCERTERAPDALRYTGRQDLYLTPQFDAGEFEIQDLASQLVGLACAPQSGETWWDTCAGEGGKTLHLCDQMMNRGLVWASDRHSGRLATLKRRAKRAQLFNYRAELWDGGTKLPTRAKFDGILVDAPCSGVGTWQRNPQARWTTTPEDVRELAAVQLALLNQVAGSLKPGGRLIYAVCTMTRSETTAVVEAFSAAQPELEPTPLAGLGSALPAVQLWPHQLNANGMFIAAWTRKK
ncbi:MAG: RsmB/NOP family class I SAM-dependent RNA methyltransferase [Opitutaceae bacterium]|nr:RsmB/NOP family class I SAM-dependent RNA methyltransferase [Opitutaceae bacterium]